MIEPVIERISDAIRSRLELFDFVDTVIRPKRIETEPVGDRKLTLTQGESTMNGELSCPGNPPAVAYDQIFIIAGEVRPSETDETPIDTIRNRFDGEIRKAIANSSDWYSFDGLAINSQLGAPTVLRDAENISVSVELLVQYRVSETDPYQVR